MENITVSVRHGQDVFTACLPQEAKVDQLMEKVEELTRVHTRKQKLIHKGKVLTAGATLRQCGVKDGTKLLLMASSGVPTQGQVLIKEKAAAAKARLEELRQDRAGGTDAQVRKEAARALQTLKDRHEQWLKTGIVSLRGAGLSTVPAEVCESGDRVRVADLAENRFAAVPPSIGALMSLQRLRLSHNLLTAQGVPWAALATLPQLSILHLDHNSLEALPDSFCQLRQLRDVRLGHNQLSLLPPGLSQLSQLQFLDVAHNRLASLPAALGACTPLEELDASGNELREVPSELRRLQLLRRLVLDKNRLHSVPPEVLRECSALNTLSLHDNPVTVEQLRDMDGFAEFNARRLAKYDKKIERRVMGSSSGFDEGADFVEWER